jgi:hypothetical protein
VEQSAETGARMSYVLDLFSPERHRAFSASDRTTCGFHCRHFEPARRIKKGDVFICYLTRVSRWVGVLEVESSWFEDDKPLFVAKDDPFIIRFKVTPRVWLPAEHGIPIREPAVWSKLSFTRTLEPRSRGWGCAVRAGLVKLGDDDGHFLHKMLHAQAKKPKPFPMSVQELRDFYGHWTQPCPVRPPGQSEPLP